MGDRANVIVTWSDEQVCLYTHWGAEDLPEVVRAALVRGVSRLDDFQYLTRIVFCEMIQGQSMGTTGFGITQKEHDGGKTVYLDVDQGTVRLNGSEALSMSDYVKHEPQVWPE